MFDYVKNWKGAVEFNGTVYPTAEAFISATSRISPPYSIILHPANTKAVTEASSVSIERVNDSDANADYRITVKKYMTQKASPDFDFMAKWNNDEPMPLRTMTGTIDEETKGMVHMTLHGDIYAEKITICMCCGKRLTNPVSQYFGIGPECGHHNYVNPFNTDEELKEAVASYKKKLQNVTWSGWIIKSAIIEREEV